MMHQGRPSGMMQGQGDRAFPEMGPGMMGPGMMGPGMMGPGIMVPGMMGPVSGYGHGMMPQMPMMQQMPMMPMQMYPMMMGYGMCPHMMGHGMMGHGMMGHGMMGQGMMGAPAGADVSEDSVREFLEWRLAMRGLTRLKVGEIDASNDAVFKADIVTEDGSLAWRAVVDRRTGWPLGVE